MAYQNEQARKRQMREEAAAYRAQQAAMRERERLTRQFERAQKAAEAAGVREKVRREKEAAAAHVEAQLAEVAARNAQLARIYDDIDSMLAFTLDIDDFVDLESLKVVAQHPAFNPGRIGTVTAPVPDVFYPPEPVFIEPEKPRGLFGTKKKHTELIEQAQAEHHLAVEQWTAHKQQLDAEHAALVSHRDEVEAKRLQDLGELRARYEAECAQREADATARNEELAKLINDFAFDVGPAIEEYVGIALSYSVYPETFPVEHDYQFDLGSRELTLSVSVPPPADMPSVKEWRYVKAKDEIVSSVLPTTAQKNRYASAVAQVAVRSLHEVFEADRGGKIHTIALTVGSEAIDPATGLSGLVPFVVVAAGREQFLQFDLSNVVPNATLEHLGAAISKSPFDLAPADTSRGVRVRQQ
jgi:restriction system protein